MKKIIQILIIFIFAVNIYSEEISYQLEPLKILPSQINTSFMEYSCFDVNNCVICRTDNNLAGIIVDKTSDGGKSWEMIYIDTSFKSEDSIYYPKFSAQNVKYFSDGSLIILTDHGKIIKSEDFGKSFTEYLIENYYSSGFVMLDRNNAITTSSKYLFFEDSQNFCKKSTDGCKTWTNFIIPDSIKFSSFVNVYLQPDKSIILRLSNKDTTKSFFLKTNFEGTTWKYIETPRVINKVIFLNENEILGVGSIEMPKRFDDTAVIYKSYDGGLNWELKFKTVFPLEFFSDISYIDDNLIFVSGSMYTFCLTIDQGESWIIPQIEYVNGAHNGSWFTTQITRVGEETYYLKLNFQPQFLKATRKTNSVLNASLKQGKIFPNPISNGNIINLDYEVFQSGNIKIYISDLSGREIVELFNGFQESGQFNQIFSLPEIISSGSYWFISEMNGNKHIQMLNVVK
jgi:photosystem II stability/assembly factor-like uncharacterized protein